MEKADRMNKLRKTIKHYEVMKDKEERNQSSELGPGEYDIPSTLNKKSMVKYVRKEE